MKPWLVGAASLVITGSMIAGSMISGVGASGASVPVPHATQPLSTVRSFSNSAFQWNGGMALVGSDLWIVNDSLGSLVEVSTSNGSIIRTLPEFTFPAPCDVAYDGTNLWVTSCGGSSVSEVDPTTGTVTQVLSGGSYGFAHPTAIVCSSADCWVANANDPDESITEFSTADGSWVRTLTGSAYGFGFQQNVPNMTLSGDALWVANSRLSSVDEIQASTGSLVRQIVGSGYGLKYPQAVSVDGPDVWIVNGTVTADAAIEVAASSGKLIRKIGPAVASHGVPLNVLASGAVVWLVFWNQGVIEELNALDGLPIRTFEAPSNPIHYAFPGPWSLVRVGSSIWASNDDFSGILGEVTGGLIRSSIRVTPSPRTVRFGHAVTLIATGLALGATGTIRFASRRRTLCATDVVDGHARCATSSHLASGTYVVVASYGGDSNFTGSSGTTRFAVAK